MEELKRCPFCGGEIYRLLTNDYRCDHCYLEIPRWVNVNSRPGEDALQAGIDNLHEQKEKLWKEINVLIEDKDLLMKQLTKSLDEIALLNGIVTQWREGIHNTEKELQELRQENARLKQNISDFVGH